ncbi:hypothetical protein Rxycam_00634 [Rubrobacter xylanophilus DSM 9941]|nr:DUF305 domain-containing protein [Rubrobacter xylanophilus]QYJ14827.1 hypothetical protein Rxycam_00634 [Rubrobacter xylanophilus DSM 9941]
MGSLSDFFDKHDPDGRWRAGALTGLASGTFSTVLISLGGPRIGRDVPLDWMEIASINLRDRAIVSEPGWPQVLPGILTHQSVDLAWAAAYFGLGIGHLGQEKQRKALLAGAIPWAVASSAFEFFVAIPILQRLLKMQVPYWTGLTVHLASSVAYPLFLRIRRRIAGEETTPDEDRLARLTLLAMGGSIAALALLEVLARKGHEPRWPFDREQEIEVGRSFLRQMTAHHELGVRLSRLLRDKAPQKEARVLGTLMYAEHVGELDAMRRWWRNWYGGEMPEPTEEEHERMPGMAADRAGGRAGDDERGRLRAELLPRHDLPPRRRDNHVRRPDKAGQGPPPDPVRRPDPLRAATKCSTCASWRGVPDAVGAPFGARPPEGAAP